MTIKIEINGIGLREHIIRTIAETGAKTYTQETGKYLKVEALAGVLSEKSALGLLKQWLRLVWPGLRRYECGRPKHLKKKVGEK